MTTHNIRTRTEADPRPHSRRAARPGVPAAAVWLSVACQMVALGGPAGCGALESARTPPTPITRSQLDPADARPHRVLTRGAMTVKVFLPDAQAGVYRGTRFDPSSMCEVSVGTHTFFGQLVEGGHDATGHPVGLAEEFGLDGPVGFDEAGPGGTFVKIGVGLLRRPDDATPYRFNHPYDIVDAGVWTAEPIEHGIRFTHTLRAPHGTFYHDTREMLLGEDPRGPLLTIQHTLTSTGSQPILTTHYAHNLFQFNDTPQVGPDYRVSFHHDLPAPKLKKPGVWDQGTVQLSQPLATHATLYTSFDGPFTDPAVHHVRVAHATLQTAVTIHGDRAPARVALWVKNPLVCPEVFVPVEVAPGGSAAWSTRYVFETPALR